MNLHDQAGLVAFNRAMAAVIAELVDSYERQGFTRQEAVALAAVWQNGYLQVIHGQADQGADRPGT